MGVYRCERCEHLWYFRIEMQTQPILKFLWTWKRIWLTKQQTATNVPIYTIYAYITSISITHIQVDSQNMFGLDFCTQGDARARLLAFLQRRFREVWLSIYVSSLGILSCRWWQPLTKLTLSIAANNFTVGNGVLNIVKHVRWSPDILR